MSLGTKISDSRKLKNMTQENLADLLGVTRQSISRWESDIVYPDLEKIVKLSNILDVSCDYLLKNDNFVGDKEMIMSRLLEDVINKNVKFTFYEDQTDYLLLSAANYKVISVEKGWIQIEIKKITKKKEELSTKLIPVSSISSISIMEER